MLHTDFADVIGASGPSIRWERPLLFFAALFTANLLWLVYSPGTDLALSLLALLDPLNRTAPPEAWLAELLRDLVLAGLAVAAFRLIPQAAVAVLVVAMLYSPLGILIFHGQIALMTLEGGMDFGPDSIWSIRAFVFRAVWVGCFLGSLVLALRWIRPAVLALLVGATASVVLNWFVRLPLDLIFSGGLDFDLRDLVFLFYEILEMVFFAGLFWAGLELFSDRPAPAGSPPPRLSRGFYLGSLAVALGLPSLLSLATILFFNTETWGPDQAVPALLLLFVGFLLMFYGVVVFAVLIHKMWDAIQDGHARTTPGKAVGFLFIPFYNLYWGFQAFGGWVTDYNAFAARHGLAAPRLQTGLFTAYMVLCIGSLVPVLGMLASGAALVVGLMMVSKICDAVNALPRPRPAAPRAPGPGYAIPGNYPL